MNEWQGAFGPPTSADVASWATEEKGSAPAAIPTAEALKINLRTARRSFEARIVCAWGCSSSGPAKCAGRSMRLRATERRRSCQ
jgi:hypothetical protein